MPPYSGPTYKVLVRAHRPNAHAEIKDVDSILGRILNLEAELFDEAPGLQQDLEELGYNARAFTVRNMMSIYPGVKFLERNYVQRLQDQLYEVLQEQGSDHAYGLLAAMNDQWMLVVKLDRERYNPENPCPETLTIKDVKHDIIGYILDNEAHITAPGEDIKRYLFGFGHTTVLYKFLDKTNKREYERAQEAEVAEKVRKYKSEKRKAKKLAAKKAADEDAAVE